MTAKVGGFMLLHHLFKELVLIEVESSSDIWPIADRVLVRTAVATFCLGDLFPCFSLVEKG